MSVGMEVPGQKTDGTWLPCAAGTSDVAAVGAAVPFLALAGCCWGTPRLAHFWVGDQCGASPALGARKPLERNQSWAGAQEVFESPLLKGGLTPCSPGPLSLRGRQHAESLAILAVRGLSLPGACLHPGHEHAPPISAQALTVANSPSLGFRLIPEA